MTIKKTDVSKPISNKIKPTEIKKELVSFSYKYLQENSKFKYSSKQVKYFCKLIERMRDISFFTVKGFKCNRSDSLRCHTIDWNFKSITEKSFGLLKEEELVGEPYQFEITKKKHGRVHGFFIGTVFHIRWLDPDHKLYN